MTVVKGFNEFQLFEEISAKHLNTENTMLTVLRLNQELQCREKPYSLRSSDLSKMQAYTMYPTDTV